MYVVCEVLWYLYRLTALLLYRGNDRKLLDYFEKFPSFQRDNSELFVITG